MANEGIEVEVYRFNNPKVRVDTLNNRIDPKALCELGNGAGSVKISALDPKIIADPTLMDYRNILKFRVDGHIVAAFQVLTIKAVTLTEKEKAGEYWELSGPGLRIWLDDAEVRPWQGLTTSSKDNRYFNFAAEEGDWYVPADWVNSVAVPTIAANHWKGAPVKWPTIAKNVGWMWGVTYTGFNAPVGYNYFRKSFTVSEVADYHIYVTADDSFDIYLDGEMLASTDPSSTASWQLTTLNLKGVSVGTHLIAIRAHNGWVSGLAGVRIALTKEVANNNESLVMSSSDTWKALSYPEVAPGWSPGEILLTLLEEAETRGVLMPTWLTPTFTSTVDSYGDAWADPLDWSFKVGDSLLSVVKKLEELSCKVWIDPDTYEIHMAPDRGEDRSVFNTDGSTIVPPVIFKRGKNLIKAESTGTGKIKNALSIKTNSGWIDDVTSDEASLTKYGRIEGTLNTGASETVSRALAEVVFAEKGIAREGATYSIVATDDIPAKDFHEGDWVLGPNDYGVEVKRRLMSISISEGEAGQALYDIEFDNVFKDNESKIIDTLDKTGNGGTGSNYNNNEGGSTNPQGPIIVIPTEPPTKIPLAPENVGATSTGLWDPTGIIPLSEVTVTWDAVTLNTDGSDTLPEYYRIWSHKTGTSLDEITQIGQVAGNLTSVVLTQNPGTSLDFLVTAVNINDSQGDFSDPFSYTPIGPTAAMNAPDDPTLAVNKALLLVTWNGLLQGVAPPPQFRNVYALVSETLGGTYEAMGAAFFGPNTISIAGLTVGQEYFVKLIAVDGLGILSAASGIANITLTGIDLGDLDESVGEAIDAAREAGLAARSTINLLEDESFELNTEEFWDLAPSGVTNITTEPRTGLRHLGVEAQGTSYEAFKYQRVLSCDPGESYYFRIYVLAVSAFETDAINISVLYGSSESSTPNDEVIGTSDDDLVTSSYIAVTGSWIAPADTFFFKPRVIVNDSTVINEYYIDDIRVYRMTDTATLVNGSVTTDILSADSVTAEKLAANSVAAVNIQAEAITAEKLAADSVTAEAMAANSVLAANIQAGAIQTSHLSAEVGEQLTLAADAIVLIAGVQTDLDATNDGIAEMQTYYSYGPDGALISKPGSPSSLGFQNDRIEMLENGNVVSYWNSGQMVVSNMLVEKIIMGNHQIEKSGVRTVVRSL